MSKVEIIVVGTAQDGSIPHPNCDCQICQDARKHLDKRRYATSLALIDHESKEWFLFEATPDFTEQLNRVQDYLKTRDLMSGIFITHGHIGHYTGLMYLGKEAMNTKTMDTYIEPNLSAALETSIPFSFLYQNQNIKTHDLINNQVIELTPNITVTPILVPHRNEVGKTFGFKIEGPNKRLLFIPDLDNYQAMEPSIEKLMESVDHLLIDATFYTKQEIQVSRDYHLIPHPTIEETMTRFERLVDTKTIELIHFNHSNLILKNVELEKNALEKGFLIARELEIIEL